MQNSIQEKVLDKALFLTQASEIFPKDFKDVQSCLVLVTHPKDKPWGCAGLISMLVRKNIEITILLAIDEVSSPANFRKSPPEDVRLICKEQISAQLEVLGAENHKITLFEGKGASLPPRNQTGFDALAHKIAGTVKQEKPQLILAPYEFNSSGSHYNNLQLLSEALNDFGYVKVLEYPTGYYPTAQKKDLPELNPGELKRLNIEEFLPVKEKSGRNHSSPKKNPVDDNLRKESRMIEISTNYEYYIERDLQ